MSHASYLLKLLGELRQVVSIGLFIRGLSLGGTSMRGGDTTESLDSFPVTTVLFAWLILSERITIYFIIGTVLILVGMYLSNKSRKVVSEKEK